MTLFCIANKKNVSHCSYSYLTGYSMPASGTVDNFSDSGHSEISSRSSIVSNSSFDGMHLHDDRRQRHSVSIVETNLGVGRTDRRTAMEAEPCCIGYVFKCSSLTCLSKVVSPDFSFLHGTI